MAKYINEKTGAVIITDFKICGGDWKLVEEKQPKKRTKKTEEAKGDK